MHLCLCKYMHSCSMVSYLIFINGNLTNFIDLAIGADYQFFARILQDMSLHPQKVHTLKVIDWSVPLSHIMTTGFWAQTLCFLQLNSIGGMPNGTS